MTDAENYPWNCGDLTPNMSRIMGKPAFCIWANKDADQLRGNREADQRLCFRYRDSTILLLPKSEISCRDCTAWFVSDQVGNSEDRFPHNKAHIVMCKARV